MPAPVAAIAGGIGRGLLTGGRAAMAGGMRETIRGAARGAVKGGLAAGKDVASGVVKVKKKSGRERFKSPLNEGIASGGGGGAIVPFSGGGGGGMSSAIVPAPKSQVVPAAGGKGKTILDTLNQIKSLLDQILQVEKEEKSKLEDSILDFVKRDERQKRDQEQAKQEAGKKAKGKKGKENPIVKGAKKAVGGLWDFISGIVGDFIKYKILDWVSDPKNKKNVERLVVFFQGMVKFLGQVFNFVMDNMSRWMELMSNGFKLAGALLQPLIDIFTLKWLTNPGEFIKNLINLPKTLLGIIPQFFGSLLNYLTMGLFENMGKFIGDLLSNLNPFKLFGGKEEDKEETAAPQQKKEGGGIVGAAAGAIGGALGMLNPMNWFGGEAQKTASEGKDNIPKLEKGGIVGKDSGEAQETTGGVSVKPLSKLIEESEISILISDAIKPFMDMMVAPFKIIGSAIVGLILRTVSKIPFVGQFLEPIVKMAASTFGVPINVLTQLKSSTKQYLEKKIDKEKLLEKLFGGFGELKKSISESKEGENPLAKFAAGITNIGGSVAGFLGNMLFGGPAAAATRPPSEQRPSTGPDAGTGAGTGAAAPGAAPTGSVSAATKGNETGILSLSGGTPSKLSQGSTIASTQLHHGKEDTRGGLKVRDYFIGGMSGPSNGSDGLGARLYTPLGMGPLKYKKYDAYGMTFVDPQTGKDVGHYYHVDNAQHQLDGKILQPGTFVGTQGGLPGSPSGAGGSSAVHLHVEGTERFHNAVISTYADGNILKAPQVHQQTAQEQKPDTNAATSLSIRQSEKETNNFWNLNNPELPINQKPQASFVPTTSKTGRSLQQSQNESFNLRSSLSRSKGSSSVLNNSSMSNTSGSDVAESPSIGQTLPFDGLYATFKTNL